MHSRQHYLICPARDLVITLMKGRNTDNWIQ